MTTPTSGAKRRSTLTWLGKEGLWLIGIFWLLQAFVMRAYHIPTGSMEPTVLVGDRVAVNRFLYGPEFPGDVPLLGWEIPSIRFPGLRGPAPGDVMVLDHPDGSAIDLLKRCVAIGGQRVEMRAGDLYVDGLKVEEPYVRHRDRSMRRKKGQREPIPSLRALMEKTWARPNWNRDYFGPVSVPEGHIFVMGDNRDFSQDSRAWGFVPVENIHGRAMVIFLSGDPDVPLWRIWKHFRWGRIGTPRARGRPRTPTATAAA